MKQYSALVIYSKQKDRLEKGGCKNHAYTDRNRWIQNLQRFQSRTSSFSDDRWAQWISEKQSFRCVAFVITPHGKRYSYSFQEATWQRIRAVFCFTRGQAHN